MKVLTDTEIIEAVRFGRREGQTAMVSRYAERVFAMIARQVPGVMDAEELAQDTFLRAFDSINSYDPRRASLSTWLCRIAYRLTLDFLKRRQPILLLMADSDDIPANTIDEPATEPDTGREERIKLLEHLLDHLPPDERLLLTLHYFENRPLDECAFIMDASPHALRSRLYRIRKKLYQQIQEDDDDK